MAGKAVELNVAGTKCRVNSTASADELRLLTAMVEDKLAGVLKPGRPVTTQAMLLAAIALANDAAVERRRADRIAECAKQTLSRLIEHVDQVLDDDAERPSEEAHRGGSGQAAIKLQPPRERAGEVRRSRIEAPAAKPHRDKSHHGSTDS